MVFAAVAVTSVRPSAINAQAIATNAEAATAVANVFTRSKAIALAQRCAGAAAFPKKICDMRDKERDIGLHIMEYSELENGVYG